VVSRQPQPTTLTAAIALAPPGAHLVVRPGVYAEGTITITRPLTLVGEPGAVLDGQGRHTILVIAADDVTVRGLTLRNTGLSQSEERSGILVRDARRCRIEDNELSHTQFAIYLSRVQECEVRGNRVVGDEDAQTVAGNGIHAWSSQRLTIANNQVRGHRDGIYFEFVAGSQVSHNTSTRSARYGLHFMFSDDCRYSDNTFRENNNGIAVMYARRVEMLDNTFEKNWGSAAYGLLLKDINDSRVQGNRFVGNSVGLHLEGSSRNLVSGNLFRANGWALKTLANATGNQFEHNIFEANAFDVGTNSRDNPSRFRENYWDRYRGYDLDRNGIGDVPHPPVRLFALVVEQSPPTLILLRSLLLDLLDLAERVIPTLTPATLLDDRPLMRRPAQDGSGG